MKNDYLCPKCRGHLKVNNFIIITAQTKYINEGLLLLSPELGNYTIHKHPSFKFKKGVQYQFECPICDQNLMAKDVDEHLVKLLMIDEDKNEYDILFSGIFGEQCTYIIKDREVVSSWGPNTEKYMKVFEKYKEFYERSL